VTSSDNRFLESHGPKKDFFYAPPHESILVLGIINEVRISKGLYLDVDDTFEKQFL